MVATMLNIFVGKNNLCFAVVRSDRMRKNFGMQEGRLTSSIKEWPEDVIDEVRHHTICIDAHRIEAYPGEKLNEINARTNEANNK